MLLTYLLAVVLPAIARNWEMTYCAKSQAGEPPEGALYRELSIARNQEMSYCVKSQAGEPPAQTIELSGSQLGTCGGPTD